MVNLRDRQFSGERIGLIVGPPKPLPGDPVAQLAEADLGIREFGAHGFHHLIEGHAHRSLLLVLREGHDIEQRTGRCGQVVRHPGEHRVRHRVRVDLPEEGQKSELARSAGADLLRCVGDAERDVAAEPGAVHLVSNLPGVDLREGGDEIDEALLVLSPGVLSVVAGIHRLPEHLQAFRFRIANQRGVGRRRLPGIKNNADPPEGRCEVRSEIEVRLVVGNRVDREPKPRLEDGFVISRKNRAVFLQKRIIGDGKLVERELTRLPLGAFRAVGIDTGELRGGRLIRGAEFRGLDIIRSGCESGI